MDTSTANESIEYYKAYEEYSKTLRTWFVAYGIGAPAIFLTNETAAHALRSVSDVRCIVVPFLVGVMLQVALASVNKVAMWVLYFGGKSSQFKKTQRYKLFNRLSAQFWIDISIDIVTMLSFSYATWRVIMVVVSSAK